MANQLTKEDSCCQNHLPKEKIRIKNTISLYPLQKEINNKINVKDKTSKKCQESKEKEADLDQGTVREIEAIKILKKRIKNVLTHQKEIGKRRARKIAKNLKVDNAKHV